MYKIDLYIYIYVGPKFNQELRNILTFKRELHVTRWGVSVRPSVCPSDSVHPKGNRVLYCVFNVFFINTEIYKKLGIHKFL